MAEESNPTKKLKLRPRWLDRTKKSPNVEGYSESAGGGEKPVLKKIARRKIRVSHALLALCGTVGVAVVLSSMAAWNLGVNAGRKELLAERTKVDVTVSEEFFSRLNRAFDDLRAGDTGNALKGFQDLETQNPHVSSLAYLVALAAMRSGNIGLAEVQAARSIRKGEKVADAITLHALIQAQKGGNPKTRKFGDPLLRSELLLRQAMLADVANPLPMIELSAVLRRQRKNVEAIGILWAARSRVQPVDLLPFIDAIIGLATLQDSPDWDLPEISDPGKDLGSAISAAYISMRKGRFREAAKILTNIRNQTTPALFRYLMNDQAIRTYSREPELREFFRQH